MEDEYGYIGGDFIELVMAMALHEKEGSKGPNRDWIIKTYKKHLAMIDAEIEKVKKGQGWTSRQTFHFVENLKMLTMTERERLEEIRKMQEMFQAEHDYRERQKLFNRA